MREALSEHQRTYMNSAQNEPCKMGFIKYECALCGSFDRPYIPIKFKEQPSITSNYFHIKFHLK